MKTWPSRDHIDPVLEIKSLRTVKRQIKQNVETTRKKNSDIASAVNVYFRKKSFYIAGTV